MSAEQVEGIAAELIICEEDEHYRIYLQTDVRGVCLRIRKELIQSLDDWYDVFVAVAERLHTQLLANNV
jgi:hypothetical protein